MLSEFVAVSILGVYFRLDIGLYPMVEMSNAFRIL